MALDPRFSSFSSSPLPLPPSISHIPLPLPFASASLHAIPLEAADGTAAVRDDDEGDDTVLETLDDLPQGYRFCPSDLDLVEDYLMYKFLGWPLRWDFIKEIDLYKYDAGDLPRPLQYNEHQSYFFVRPSKKYPKGSRPSRSTPGGYWKATGRDTEIRNAAGVHIGFRKSLVFYTGKIRDGKKTGWIMQEFRLSPELQLYKDSNRLQTNKYVLCKVYDRTKPSKDSDENGEQSEAADETSGEAITTEGNGLPAGNGEDNDVNTVEEERKKAGMADEDLEDLSWISSCLVD